MPMQPSLGITTAHYLNAILLRHEIRPAHVLSGIISGYDIAESV